MVRSRALLIVLLTPLVTTLSSCVETSASSRPVSPGVMKALQDQSQDITAFATGGGPDSLRITSTSQTPGVVTVPMTFRDGLPRVPCVVNGGMPVHLVLDTGSQTTLLEARAAVANHLRIVKAPRWNFTLRGVAGAEPALFGIAETAQIGQWRMTNLPFLVRTRESRVRLALLDRRSLDFDVLGMNVLRRSSSCVTLDFFSRNVTFGSNAPFKPSATRFWRLPMRMVNGLPHTTFVTNGIAWDAMIDTGANATIEFSKETADKIGALKHSASFVGARSGLGSGDTRNLGLVRMSRFDGLGPKFANVDAMIVGDVTKVGCGLLRQFRVTLDFRRKALWIEDPR